MRLAPLKAGALQRPAKGCVANSSCCAASHRNRRRAARLACPGTGPSWRQIQYGSAKQAISDRLRFAFMYEKGIAVAPFTQACNGGVCIAQPNSQKLDSLGDRLMYRLAYRVFGDHASMVVNHSVAAGS